MVGESQFLVVTLLMGCVAPHPIDEKVPSGTSHGEPTVKSAPAGPTAVVEQPALAHLVVGPNPGCPALRVFNDLDDLCDRGIMPLNPIGNCDRKQAVNRSEEDVYGFPIVQVAAFGGVAELVAREYADAGGTASVMTYLALRAANGYVLLAEVARFDRELNYPPTGESFQGTANTLELRITQELLEPSKVVATTLSCSIDKEGGIRCGGTCPTLATEKLSQPLDCAEIVKYDWDRIPPGDEVTARWGGNFDDERLRIVLRWLVARGKKSAANAGIALVRDVNIGNAHPLTIIELKSKDWVLLHGEVPLLASDDEIRVGQGPGGIFVVSHASKVRRIHRLNLSTHELEMVLPEGTCELPE